MKPPAKKLQEILDLHVKIEDGRTYVNNLVLFITRIQRLERSRVSQALHALLNELDERPDLDTHMLDEVFEIIDTYIDK